MAITDKSEWILYDTDLTTRLRYLPVASGHLLLEMNTTGTGEVKIPLESEAAGILTTGMFVQNQYRGSARGGFFIDNIKKDEVNLGENGERFMSISGNGASSILEHPIVWDGGTTESKREFSGMSKAAILIDLLEEAQARGGLPTLTWDFTDTEDSDAVAWDDTEEYQITTGDSILNVLQNLADVGSFDFHVELSGGNFVLSLYKNGIGTNKANTVFFRAGTNCKEIATDIRGDDLVNVYLVKYKDGFTVVKDDASVAANGRREKIINVEQAQSVDSAVTYAAAKLADTKDPKTSHTLNVYDGQKPFVFVDYVLGDTVTYDVKGIKVSHRILRIQADYENDDFANVIVELNNVFNDGDLKRANDLDWLLRQWNTARDANLLEVRQWVALGLPDDNISRISTILVDGDVVYFGGYFTKIGGITAVSGVASYNMKTGEWASLGGATSFFSTVRGLAKFNGNLYAIGEFSSVWEWDGTDWNIIGVFDDFTSAFSIVSDGDYLYISGNQTTIDGDVLAGTARWDGFVWSSANLGIANSLIWDGTNFYAGLSDGKVKTSSDGVVWTQLGSAFSGPVYAVANIGDEVIAGGDFTGFLSRWDGLTWTTITGITDIVRSLKTYLADIYVGGDFPEGIQRYSGGFFYSLASGVNGEVYAINLYGTTVIVGGDNITQAGEISAIQLAAYFTDFNALADTLSSNANNFDLGAAIRDAPTAAIADADKFPFWKSAGNLLKSITWASIKATLKTYFDTLYFALANMLVGDEEIAVGNATGQLVGDALLRWKLRGLRIGQNSTEFDFADVFPLAVVAKNVDESIALVALAYGDAGGGFPTASWRSYRARGALGAFTAVQTGDYFQDIRALAYDGANFFTGWQIRGKVTENWSPTNRGTASELLHIRKGESTRHVTMTFHGDGSFAPEILTADPPSPEVDSMWLLRETTPGHADGEAMGPLGMTYTGDTGTVQPLKLSVNDGGTTRRIPFV